MLVPPEAAYLTACRFAFCLPQHQGFPSGSDGKDSARNVGDLGPIPGLGRFPAGGHGNPLQYSRLENPHGRRRLSGYGLWGRKESGTTEMTLARTHL